MKKYSNEKEVQKSIIEYLTLKRYFFFRNNTGALKTEHGFYKFGAVGSPDIIAVVKGQFIGIECKDKSKMSDAQIEFSKNLMRAGGEYILVHSIDDLIKSGL